MSKYIIRCINPTEFAVFKHISHIRPNHLSGYMLVPMQRCQPLDTKNQTDNPKKIYILHYT